MTIPVTDENHESGRGVKQDKTRSPEGYSPSYFFFTPSPTDLIFFLPCMEVRQNGIRAAGNSVIIINRRFQTNMASITSEQYHDL